MLTTEANWRSPVVKKVADFARGDAAEDAAAVAHACGLWLIRKWAVVTRPGSGAFSG